MKNLLNSFSTANLSEAILQSAKCKEVRREWLQDEKLSHCGDYFDRLVLEKYLRFNIPVPELAKLLYQDPSKQQNVRQRAYKYRNCWAFRTTRTLEGETTTQLDVIQIKVPKEVQEETQKYYNEKHRREGGELKKAPKYLSSQGVAAPIFLMPIENRGHQNVVNNPNCFEITAQTWEQVKNDPRIPIIIIEGAKKGAVLAAHGYIVIVLPGVWQGLKKGEEYGKEINQIIEQFCSFGRQFYIAFDNDPVEKKGTREGVGLALLQLGKKLQQKTLCRTKVITWEQYQEKGADDLVAEHGIEAFNIAYRLAKPLGEWESIHSYAIYEKPDLEFFNDNRYFPDFEIPEAVTKALIVGTQGTGKSCQLKRLIKKWLKKGYGVVAVTMSDSLKKQSCDKWGLSTIEALWNGKPIKKQSQESLDHQLYIGEKPSKEKTRSLTGFMGCADSMYKLYTKIKELVDNGAVKGFILILDEVEALFDHILTSTTEVSKNLPENIRMFRELIHDCHLLIAADADASGMTWDLINKLKGGKSFYIKNHYKHSGRKIVKWPNYYEMINVGLLKIAKSNTKKGIVITTQGGKEGSKTGAYTLEDVLAGSLNPDEMEQDHNNAMDAYKLLECSGRKIWVITARTISDKKHPCYQVIKDEETFNNFIHRAGENGDIVIISNVIPTGFSIDEPHNFGYQFSFGTGVNNPVGFVQHINRLRGDDVERHIAVATRSSAKYGNGSTTYKGILAGIDFVAKSNKKALKEWFNIDVEDIQEDNLFRTYSARIFARNNAASQDYEGWVTGRLKYASGYQVISSEEWLKARTESFENQNPVGEIIYSEDESLELHKGIKPLKAKIKIHAAKDMIRRYQRVADQKSCTPDEYKCLQDKKRKGVIGDNGELERLTPHESDRLLRAEFVEHTGGTLPVTAENLKKYDQDGFLGKLRLFHHATTGRDQVGELSALALERACKGRNQVIRKTNQKLIAGKLKYLSDNGCDDLLNILYEIVQAQSTDQNFYINYINRNLDQNFDQFFALDIPNDPNNDTPNDPNNSESSKEGLGGDVVRIEVLPKGFDNIRQAFRNTSYACKQLLGVQPATEYCTSFARQFLGLFGLELVKEGKRRSEKYYLVVPQDAHLYLNFLQERSQPKPLMSPENQKTMDLIIDKSNNADAVTSYIKDAVAGLPALEESTTLSDLVGWGTLQNPVLTTLKTALDSGYEDYNNARQELFSDMEDGHPIINRIISDGISNFEVQNKEKIAKIQPIFYASREALNNKDLWIKEIDNCNPAALLIDRIRRGVDATQSFVKECREVYQNYSQAFDSWLSQKFISPSEYLAVRGN